MNPNRPSLRFDHREITVIFSLFIFVSLLMFTVGILVGKGLAQAKWDRRAEGLLLPKYESERPPGKEAKVEHRAPSTGTSVTTRTEMPPTKKIEETRPARETVANIAPVTKEAIEGASNPKWFAQKPKESPRTGSLLEPTPKEVEHVLNNPKIQGLIEADNSPKAIAKEAHAGRFPASFEKGKYTVQVGSYVNEKDAAERVEALKKLGFPHAHFSATQLGEAQGVWYRVWTGHYTDYSSADRGGRMLKELGEVKNYLVRKAENAGG